ncbi:unnamed protein product [Trichobilharzia szidati]|nr:unnamed protein product [Trichobilharzia szidati]
MLFRVASHQMTLEKLNLLYKSRLRDYILRHYPSLKSANPHVKFMVRESEDITPKVFARYEMGKEACISIANNTAEEIAEKLKSLNRT